jgi:hypothetical protein
MVTGQPPWSTLRFRSLVALAKGVEQHRMPPIPSCLSSELQRLLKSCFTWAPADRPTARELLLRDFCRSVHCQECVDEPASADYGYDSNCYNDSDDSCSSSRRSSVSSDGSTATQALSSLSSNSSENSSDELSPSNWANSEPTTPRSDLSVATSARHSAAAPSAYWSESLLTMTKEPTTRKAVAADTTAAAAVVSDSDSPLEAACAKKAEVRRANRTSSSNPFAGRIRVTAGIQPESCAAVAAASDGITHLGASALQHAVKAAGTTSINPFAGRVRVALQTQPDVTASSAAAAVPADAAATTTTQTINRTTAVGGTTTITTTTTTTITTVVTTVTTSNASVVDATSGSAPS